MSATDKHVSTVLSEINPRGSLDSTILPTTPACSKFTPSAQWRARWIGLTEHTAELEKMAIATEVLIKAIFLNVRDKPTLILCGKSGRGKTHCARAVARSVQRLAVTAWEVGHWSRPPGVQFVRWAEFIDSESDGIERDAREADVLILDDVGSETDRYKTGAPLDKFCRLLDWREGRFSVVTTNLSLEQWAAKDPRIADRMLRRSVVIRVHATQSWSIRSQLPHDALQTPQPPKLPPDP